VLAPVTVCKLGVLRSRQFSIHFVADRAERPIPLRAISLSLDTFILPNISESERNPVSNKRRSALTLGGRKTWKGTTYK